MSFKTSLITPEVFVAKLRNGAATPDPIAPRYHKVIRSPSGKLYYLLPKRNEPGKFYKKYLSPNQSKRCLDGRLAVHKGGVCRAKKSKKKQAAAKAVVTRRVNDKILGSAKQVKAQRKKQKKHQQPPHQ